MKKKSTALVALALAGVLLTGGTFAYLQSTTNEAKNTFTMGEGVSAEITEPGWEATGKDAANNFYPGLVIAKDPQVTNNSQETGVYAAVKITYTNKADGSATTYADLSRFLNVAFDTTGDWTFNASKTVAYYKGELAADATTVPVFSTVTIKNTATHPDQQIPATAMKDFDITVKGYVCQTDVEGTTTAKDALNKVFPELDVE